jgi:hypothetical protein
MSDSCTRFSRTWRQVRWCWATSPKSNFDETLLKTSEMPPAEPLQRAEDERLLGDTPHDLLEDPGAPTLAGRPTTPTIAA